MTGAEPGLQGLTVLLQLEAEARKAQTEKALQFLIVNETRRLLPFRQAFLLSAARTPHSRCKVEAASSIAVIDRNAPLIRWVEDALHDAREKEPGPEVQSLDSSMCRDVIAKDWDEFSLPHVVWCPFLLPDGTFIGGLWLARESTWQESELTLIKRLCETYAHAWVTLVGKKRLARKWTVKRGVIWGVLVAAIVAMFLPVRLSTLAPVEVVAEDPVIVSAPMDGVIADIKVPPNQLVGEGELLFTYEDTNFRNEYEVAEKTLAVALAEFRKASQGAFRDAQSKADVALLKARVRLAKAERDYAREILDQVEVKALGAGLLLYTDEADWIGRPVVVGERIMEIADSDKVELRVNLSVDDAIVLNEGADVQVFLDVDPLHSLDAVVQHASYKAEVVPGDILAYRVTADLQESDASVRIGLQGTAKIYSEPVSLFFYIFRRPIGAVRQFFGI